MAKEADKKPEIDRKRSLAAKKGAKTRARNRLLSEQRQLKLHHKILASGAIFATLLFAALGIHSQLSAYAASTTGTTIIGYNNRCLDNKDSQLKNRNILQLHQCNGSNAQRWTINTDGTIRNVSGNYCVDVTNASTREGTYVQLYTCNGTDAQKFSIIGTVIANTKSGLSLTARLVSSSKGDSRIVMKRSGSPVASNQKWYPGAKSSTGGATTTPSIPNSGTGTTPSTPASPVTQTPSATGTTKPTSPTTPAPSQSGSSASANSGTSTNSVAGNLAVLPDFYDSTWLSWNDGYNKFPVTWQGYSNVLQVAPNPQFITGQRASGWTGENEIIGMVCSNGTSTGCSRSDRGNRVAIKPGSKVTYSAYVWVTPSTVGASSGGGFQFFMDIYGPNGRIKELQGTNGCDGCGRINVPFGSKGWTFVQMQFTVASGYSADGALGYSGGSGVKPTGIIPILQLNNWAVPSGYNEKATAYVRNTILTVQ